LREGGLLSKLLPESLLNIRAHQIIRKELLDQCRIVSIYMLGDIFKKVFAPSIYLHAEKQYMSYGNLITLVDKRKGNFGTQGALQKTETKLVSQEEFRRNPHFIFSVYSDPISETLNGLIEKAKDRLQNHGQFYLGIVTGNNARHIQKHKYHASAQKVITGKDVFAHYIRPSHNWIYFRHADFQQVCDESYFLKKDKLVYKFISNSLRFAIDRERRYHVNSVNGFYFFGKAVRTEFFSALLNSRLLNYYFKQRFFTRRVLRGDLMLIPIMEPEKEMQEHICSLTWNLEQSLKMELDFSEKNSSMVQETAGGRNNLSGDFPRVKSSELTLNELETAILDLYKIPSYLRKNLDCRTA
jgi:hypothetical protein